MLKKANRLAKAKDINSAFARGRTFFNPFFNLKVLIGGTKKLFTVVVSTKVYKKAHSRNRLKRILREELRKNISAFKNGSYVIMAKPKVTTVTEMEVLGAFKELTQKLNRHA